MVTYNQKSNNCTSCCHGEVCANIKDYVQFTKDIQDIVENSKGPFKAPTECAHYKADQPTMRTPLEFENPLKPRPDRR